jgi:tRNA(Ile)-lysidine synthase
MAKPARLQNLLINRKVPVSERSRRLVLETPDGVIAWVEGFPPGERFRITVQTRRILVLKIPAGD